MNYDGFEFHRTAPYWPERAIVVLLLWMSSASPASAQQWKDARIRILLEQKTGATVRAVNPQHVFLTGDRVCFRLRSSSSGFLYVSNRGSSGKYTILFPVDGPAADNRIESGREYRIPASNQAWFRLDPPPGYETIIFTFTSTPVPPPSEPDLPAAAQKIPLKPSPPPGLTPRCDDSMFRARGECVDISAGQSTISPGSTRNSTGRNADNTVVPDPDDAPVASPSTGNAPIAYQFRIAHR